MAIILGLGSNLGNRLENLRDAVSSLKQVEGLRCLSVSPIYESNALLPDNAEQGWDIPFLNAAVCCEYHATPEDLLDKIKTIEHRNGRPAGYSSWSPRLIDIDILAWHEECYRSERLTIPPSDLLERPFALWPLEDLCPEWTYPVAGLDHHKPSCVLTEKWHSRFDKKAPFNTHQIPQRLTGAKLVGILNITPDSFSDGGQFQATDDALEQAERLIEQGAEVLDIGAVSTRPGAEILSATQEWQRLEPLLAGLTSRLSELVEKPKLSLDSFTVETVRAALEFPIDWINDQSAGENEAMIRLAAENGKSYVLMHSLGLPANRAQSLPLTSPPHLQLIEWGGNKLSALTKLGLAPEQIIFDPGLGFGKSAAQSLALIKNAGTLKALGMPVLVGHSRKSFLNLVTAKPFAERDLETSLLSFYLSMQSIDYLRVHQVAYSVQAIKLMDALHSC